MIAKAPTKTGREGYYRYLPPNVPLSAIRRFARRVAERFDPEKIVLFGSFAYGTPHDYSDVDLLVVIRASNEINQAIRITLAFDREFPLDLIVRTPDRLRRRLAEGDSFLSEIMSQGIVVYEKRNPILDKKAEGDLRVARNEAAAPDPDAVDYRYPGWSTSTRQMRAALRHAERVRLEVRAILGLPP